MNERTIFEFIEILVCVYYLIVFGRSRETRLTRALFLAAIISLSIDVFVFQGLRPRWVRVCLNVPATILIWEKVVKSYAISLLQAITSLFL